MSTTAASYNISRLATNTPQAYKENVRPTNLVITVKAAKSRQITPLNRWQGRNHTLYPQCITNVLHAGIQIVVRNHRQNHHPHKEIPLEKITFILRRALLN
jgi:hypothetical protein